MSQTAKLQEPSMEEILASIRRIIADDDASKATKPPDPVAAAPSRPAPPPRASRLPPAPPTPAGPKQPGRLQAHPPKSQPPARCPAPRRARSAGGDGGAGARRGRRP